MSGAVNELAQSCCTEIPKLNEGWSTKGCHKLKEPFDYYFHQSGVRVPEGATQGEEETLKTYILLLDCFVNWERNQSFGRHFPRHSLSLSSSCLLLPQYDQVNRQRASQGYSLFPPAHNKQTTERLIICTKKRVTCKGDPAMPLSCCTRSGMRPKITSHKEPMKHHRLKVARWSSKKASGHHDTKRKRIQ